MQLPYSEELNIGYLSRLFDNTTNLLPSWELYFDGLGELEYRAYCLKTDNELVAKEFNIIAPYH